MTNVSWKNVEGTWGTGADWSTNQPLSTLNAAILSSADPPIVTLGSGPNDVAGVTATTDTRDVTAGLDYGEAFSTFGPAKTGAGVRVVFRGTFTTAWGTVSGVTTQQIHDGSFK